MIKVALYSLAMKIYYHILIWTDLITLAQDIAVGDRGMLRYEKA